MLTVTVTASLASLVPGFDSGHGHTPVLNLEADDWPGLAGELRFRYPLLADRVLTDDGAIRNGFLVVVNDEVVGGRVPPVRAGDDVFLLVQIAGG